MGAGTNIEWCDHTFNPIWGCTKVSPGCTNCYAAAFAHRLGLDVWGPGGPRRQFKQEHWDEPLRWNAVAEKAGLRQRVFCASMADVFEDHPIWELERPRLFSLIAKTPSLDWLLLTKRPENIRRFLPDPIVHGVSPAVYRERPIVGWIGEGDLASRRAYTMIWPNVWLGTTVEDQQRADERLPHLLAVPSVVRFVSCEPLLERVDLSPWLKARALHWVIAGGESGHGARPFDVRWAQELRADCEGRAAFFMKQMGSVPVDSEELWRMREPLSNGWLLNAHNRNKAPTGTVPLKFTGKGDELAEFPPELQVRQWPVVNRG
jgi:protein gp37